MHLDVESGQQLIHSRLPRSQSQSLAISLRRRWKGLPRMARLYLMIGLVVTIFLILVLYLPRNEPFVEAIDKNPVLSPPQPRTDRLDDQIMNNKPNNQLIKPIVNDNTDNDNDFRRDRRVYTQSSDHTIATIDGLSLNVFKESAQRLESSEQKAIVEALRHSWEATRGGPTTSGPSLNPNTTGLLCLDLVMGLRWSAPHAYSRYASHECLSASTMAFCSLDSSLCADSLKTFSDKPSIVAIV
ncbi:unnamed protein product [Oppiella nova]|uniref:Uncharacterized protein n=1 Tax=Oppiella nova TaxID=334625 RepID=A0A7R9M202_9ACAR|nr:unnamed protein product [Oppiella nova]CAG2169247.1 unnamed protein product [Oppiella nova]